MVFACLQAILEDLGAKGIDVHIAGYSAWGPALSVLLRRAKIVLNLHHNDAKILETCRIMESLSYGALVTLSDYLRRQTVPESYGQAMMWCP